ncbi:MAG: hypothetical protein LBC42_00535 [Puniceicoccales bacterium]|jgi:hypothetical protein|nr:hypothetical protein [Puniceicoccales bacterium]
MDVQVISSAALGGFCFLLLFIAVLRRRHRRMRIAVDTGEAGSICISRKALHAVIRSACNGVLPVGKIHICTKINGGSLSVVIHLQIPSGESVLAVAQKMQSESAFCLREQLGIEQLGTIDVLVNGFKG